MRGGRAVLVEANKKLPDWRKAVKEAAAEAMTGDLFSQPVKVDITFFMPRPAKPKWAQYPASKPDLDKLVRAVFDALTGIVWADDALAVEMTARKLWAGIDGNPPNPGCLVFVTEK